MGSKLKYSNKNILAPMVRVGTLPMRLLALKLGADIVYTEELIDWKLLKTTRKENSILGTIDFIDESDGTVVFRTCPKKEKKCLALQIGTSNAQRALKVAQLVHNDVSAIDVNMGCPKQFSIKGGMGAALLANTENAKDILSTLITALRNTNVSVTCKMRILNDIDSTIHLARQFQDLGIDAIAIHGRTRYERPQHAVHKDVIREVARNLKIPIIANGGSKDIQQYSDIMEFKEQCGVDSAMIARAAQWNVSIFRQQGMLEIDHIIEEYLKLCIEYDNTPSNTKYCIQVMLRDLQETPRGKKFLECQTLEEICDIWGLAKYCREKQLEYQNRGMQSRRDIMPFMQLTENDEQPQQKKIKFDHDIDIVKNNVAFFRAHYLKDDELPKSLLIAHAKKNSKLLPIYETVQLDRLFRSVIKYDNQRYTSTYWEKNKRFAEQGAALVCVLELGLIDEQFLIKTGSILK